MWIYVFTSLGVEFLGHMVTPCYHFIEQPNCFQSSCAILYPYDQGTRVPISPQLPHLPNTCYFPYFHYDPSCGVVSHYGISLWLWFAFLWWLMILSIVYLRIFFGEMYDQILCPFFHWAICLFIVVLHCFLCFCFCFLTFVFRAVLNSQQNKEKNTEISPYLPTCKTSAIINIPPPEWYICYN